MSNNSAVTVEGGEIGRAQAMQARAAGLAPSVRFNPILLKPGSDRTSQLVVRGHVADTVGAGDYFTHRDRLAAVVADELQSLRSEFDAVICEGAGSPAEINLRATDLANMGLARAANLPVVLVGDIDRGGLLAHLYGTRRGARTRRSAAHLPASWSTSSAATPPCWRPASTQLHGADRPAHLRRHPVRRRAVARHRGLGVGAGPSRGRRSSNRRAAEHWLRVAAIRLPRISNSTDVEALACEPGVLVRWVSDPGRPRRRRRRGAPRQQGHRGRPGVAARTTGWPTPSCAHAARGKPVLGICGGFQMLCRRIDDPVESRAGTRRRPRPARRRHRLRARQDAAAPRCSAARLRDPPRPGRPLQRGRLARAWDSPRRRLRHPLARSARQR